MKAEVRTKPKAFIQKYKRFTPRGVSALHPSAFPLPTLIL